ncbi:MAG: metallophosphoesterase [Eubacteriales bacterium]|nr:metallophosphoesterase [Eubacteriales bacterium]
MLLAVLFAAFDARLAVRKYAVSAPGFTAPVRLALLSDLHSCDYGAGQSELLAALEKQAPDAVLLGGDIFDDHLPGVQTEAFLKLAAQKWPCYYVSGNHEYWSGQMAEMKNFLRACGIAVLEGNCVPTVLNGQTINLCGIDDPEVERQAALKAGESPANIAAQLERTREGRISGAFTLLLAHRPERISQYTSYGFDAVLSGHAHGGQWRLPGLLNGLYAPDQGFFPAYAGGTYPLERGTLVVSRGLARESTRIPRIFNRPELVMVVLTPPV